MYINSIIKPVREADAAFDIPAIIANEDPPEDIAQAKQRWIKARAEFEKVMRRSQDMAVQVQNAYAAQKQIDELMPARQQADAYAEDKKDAYDEYDEIYQNSVKHRDDVKENLKAENERERLSNQLKPGWLRRIFKRREGKAWQASHRAIIEALLDMQTTYGEALKNAKTNDVKRQNGEHEWISAQREVDHINHDICGHRQQIDEAQLYCGDQLISQEFWQRSYSERQKSSPNFSKDAHLLRDDVFIAAIKLNKAFIDAASKKLRHNLRLFFGEIAGDRIPHEKRRHLALIWKSIFLITPVISTTFASVGRMLKDLPQENIGWLLIDEAGQAKPQEAIGAIYRARRVIAVGDPLQVEPIEPLPLPLVENIGKYLGVDSFRWLAPHASVQTVADHANSFGATIQREDGDVRIGSPLVVHRRCDEPMFSMSNKMAYAGMMVHATVPENSPIAVELGHSQWFDITGSAQEKWCPEEGEKMQDMVEKILSKLNEVPDFYVISPFKTVAQNAFRLLYSKAPALKARGIDNPYKWLEKRVGTVHTF